MSAGASAPHGGSTVRIVLIAAMSENRVIGRDNRLPWHLPDDLKHFKALTTGHAVIMGRRTFESMGKPLPNRTNIVLTRQRGEFAPAGALIASSMEEAMTLAQRAGSTASGAVREDVFIIGGSKVFELFLPRAERMHLTLVQATIEGDVYFPDFDRSQWTVTESVEHPADAKHAYAFTMQRLDRISS